MTSFDHFAKWFFAAFTAFAITLFLGTILATISSEFVAPVRLHTASRSVDSSNLRMIGQSSLIYAIDHEGHLPDAEDLPDYARLLALSGGLDDATCWVAHQNRSALPADLKTILITTSDGSRTIDPRFADLPHLFTVVLGGLTDKHPATTPVAWTRGLDFETGRWHKDSPYGGEGGHILLLDGTVKFHRKLTNSSGGELVGRDGRATHRVLDALPVGIRVSGSTTSGHNPTPRERLRDLAHGASDLIRTGVLVAWPLWMLVFFLKLTVGLARTWGIPISQLRIEPRSRWLVLTPAALLLLSVVFQV